MAQQIQAWNDADGLLETTGTGVTFAASGVSETVKCHPYPGETYTKVYGNRIMGKYLKSDIPVLPEVSGVTNHPQACLRTSVRKNDNPTAQTIDYVEDYSYEDISGVQKYYKKTDTVNGHLDSRMYAMYSKYVELTGATIDVSWGEIANVNVSPSQIHSWQSGLQTSLTIGSNVSWTIGSEADWITFSTESGTSGVSTVNILIDQSYDFSARTADIEISYQDYRGTETIIIPVLQEAFVPSWYVNPTGITFSQEGGSENIQNIWVQTNLPLSFWEFTTPEWITGTTYAVALNNYRIACVAGDYMTGATDRSGDIVISHSGLTGVETTTVRATQRGGFYFVVEPLSISFRPHNTTYQNVYLNITTNLSSDKWAFTNPSWVHILTPTVSGDTTTYKVYAGDNNNFEARNGVITVTYTAGTITSAVTVDVTQDYYGAIQYHASQKITPNKTDGIVKHSFSNGVGLIYYSGDTIPDYAFSNTTGMTDIEFLGDKITTIGAEAFFNAGIGGELQVPSSITTLGNLCFGRNNFTGATITTGTTNIVGGTFADNDYLVDVTLPSNLSELPAGIFNDCNALTGVSIPSGVTVIGSGAFGFCSSLADITLPDGVTSIGNNAFEYTTSLSALTIPTGVTYIGNGAFYGSGLSGMTLPDSVETIGYSAFTYSNHIQEIRIGSGVTSIGDKAFSACTSLADVTITSTGVSIPDSCFTGCTSIDEVYIGGGLVSCSAFQHTGIKKLTTGPGAVNLDSCSFCSCSGLTEVNISSGTVGSNAFSSCHHLSSVTLGDGVTSIGSQAFWNNTGLKYLDIGSGITTIKLEDFVAAESIETVYIRNTTPPTLIRDGGTVFGSAVIYVPAASVSAYRADSAWRFYNIQPIAEPIPNDEIWYTTTNSTTVSINTGSTAQEWAQNIVSNTYSGDKGVIKYNTDITDTPTNFIRGTNIVTIILPNALTVIGQTSFKGCSSLTSLTLPDSLTTIGESSVAECTSLTAVTIPTGVTTINRAAFSGSTSLNNIVFPEGITVLNEFMFRSCSGLNTVSLPSTITSIGDRFFDGCTSLATVNYNGTTSQWQALSKGNYWKNNVPSSCKVYCTNGTINI